MAAMGRQGELHSLGTEALRRPAPAVRPPRWQFSIRGLMIAVAVVAGFLGVLEQESLREVARVVLGMLAWLVGAVALIIFATPDRKTGLRRRAVLTTVVWGLAVLGAGWLCARMCRAVFASAWATAVPLILAAIGAVSICVRLVRKQVPGHHGAG